MTVTAETATAVFAAAASSTYWIRTNLGPRTVVSHEGYDWTIELPAGDQPGRARITYCAAWGNTEFLDVPAAWGQTIQIVEAAMAATRVL
ncbi:hypothetical protein [Streptomyces sp. NRRL S-350]|uniref:hypothetical protein n=1 Tax=Streptomyces sp. NRRL S-350 TaxID=1463902 RepID=UPI0004C2A180|nr:hypothetical protein [Streptomyces sp. NRRL S-350]